MFYVDGIIHKKSPVDINWVTLRPPSVTSRVSGEIRLGQNYFLLVEQSHTQLQSPCWRLNLEKKYKKKCLEKKKQKNILEKNNMKKILRKMRGSK